MTIGYFPLVHTATAVHADQAGIFEKHGLDVELKQTGGGAEAIPPLVSGELDIMYGNYTSVLLATQRNLPVRLLAGNDVGAEDHGIMVMPDSDINGPADLSGKTIAVNNLQNIGTVAIYAQAEDAGVDPKSISLVEMPYPNMQAALQRGDLDGIWQVEPFRTTALNAGQREAFPLFDGAVADMPVAGWVTTQKFAEENPEAVKAFRAAIAESMKELSADRSKLDTLVPTYTQVPAAVASAVAPPRWDAELDTKKLTLMSDLMVKYGIIQQAFDIDGVIVP